MKLLIMPTLFRVMDIVPTEIKTKEDFEEYLDLVVVELRKVKIPSWHPGFEPTVTSWYIIINERLQTVEFKYQEAKSDNFFEDNIKPMLQLRYPKDILYYNTNKGLL